MSRSLTLAAAMLVTHAVSAHNVIELHGSGTTNPSRWYWEIFDIISARAKEPLHMTYRAVGSSTGMQEFVGPNNNYLPVAHFGSGDIPMSASRFQELIDHNRTMLHVPVAIGAIAVFHSVPEGDLLGDPLELNACLLARIYSGDIGSWNHADIVAINPNLANVNKPIKVAHRVEGSSSTSGFTSYLSQKCPEKWTLGGASTFCAQGCANDWPTGDGKQGSGGMSGYLEEEPYAIAYIDSGHGISAGLSEIALQNHDGVYLKSIDADIGAAATVAIQDNVFPSDPSASFADVELYDLPGPSTWPITMVTYIYLQKNWTGMEPESAGLLEAFVKFVISDEGQDLAEDNLFIRMPSALLSLANDAIAQVDHPAGRVQFTFETSTLKEAGQEDYVISAKRESFADYERKELKETVKELQAKVAALGPHFEMHGSGTTNPSRWFWEAFDILTARTKERLHMTYRAVGSSTGMQEFVGPSNGYHALADFGAGDIPMSASRFQELIDHDRQMLHVPIAVGAIGIFHSIPEAELGGSSIQLDPCLLARIYAGEIEYWNHADILAENPNLKATSRIYVAHRVEGSSSTSGLTAYLTQTCGSVWTYGAASTFCSNGCAADWPTGTGHQGSGGMTTYLEERPYAIAYIDAGHGIDNGLAEISLKNFDGTFLKASEADVGAAAVQGIDTDVFPTEPDASFEDVDLYNLPGADTWPITMITYIYLEKDWSAKSPETAALLEAFVKFIISDEGQDLAEENLFVRMPSELVALAQKALGMITFPSGMIHFTWEADTLKEDGQKSHVISAKRQNYGDYERKELIDIIETLKEQQALTQTINAELSAKHEEYDRAVEFVDNQANNKAMAVAGLILGLLGMILGAIALFVALYKRNTMSTPTFTARGGVEMKSDEV